MPVFLLCLEPKEVRLAEVLSVRLLEALRETFDDLVPTASPG
jgi:hypothetical protein